MVRKNSQYLTIPQGGPYAWPGEDTKIENVEDVRYLLGSPLKDLGAKITNTSHGFDAEMPDGAFLIVLFGEPPK